MPTNGAEARYTNIYAAKSSSASGIAAIFDEARSPTVSASTNVPKIVASKARFGDWEADTIIGARHKGGIVSIVEQV